MIEIPKALDVVPVEKLEALAAMIAEPASTPSAKSNGQYDHRLDVPKWLSARGVAFTKKDRASADGRTVYKLEKCPFDSSHGKNGEVSIMQESGGKLSATCMHDSATAKGGRNSKRRSENPTPTTSTRRILLDEGNILARRAPRVEVIGEPGGDKEVIDEWPDPPSGEAFYGLAGELVRTIEPHSEADPVALLVQSLVAFGSIIGRGAHFLAEADRHYCNLFTVLVGRTAKGRKGTSWGQVGRIMASVDQTWANRRILGGLSSGEGLIWAVRDPITKQEAIREATKGVKGVKGVPKSKIVGYEEIEVDLGEPDKRLLVLESEFGSVLKVIVRERNTLSAIIRQAWDTGTLRTLTKNALPMLPRPIFPSLAILPVTSYGVG